MFSALRFAALLQLAVLAFSTAVPQSSQATILTDSSLWTNVTVNGLTHIYKVQFLAFLPIVFLLTSLLVVGDCSGRPITLVNQG